MIIMIMNDANFACGSANFACGTEITDNILLGVRTVIVIGKNVLHGYELSRMSCEIGLWLCYDICVCKVDRGFSSEHHFFL
jgi:hypothetical protein